MKEKIKKALDFIYEALFSEIGLCILRIIPFLVLVVGMSFIDPVCIYIFGSAVIIAVPIIITFAFISK